VTTETTTAPAAADTPSTTPAADTAQSAAAAPATTTSAATGVVPAEAPATTEAPKVPVGAPEKYDFKNAEGKVSPTVLAKFEGIARELGLPQDAAVKLIDTIAPEMQAAVKAQRDSQTAKWAESAKSDKEFGGDKLDANLAVARKALETIGTPELTKMLNDTGLGNHPEIIRAFFRAGQKISSGNFVPSGAATQNSGTPSSKLYPTMK